MTPEQIRDYEYPGVYRRPGAPSVLVGVRKPDGEVKLIPHPSRWSRHTTDTDRKPPEPKKSRGAVVAWIVMGVVVTLYVWAHWPK